MKACGHARSIAVHTTGGHYASGVVGATPRSPSRTPGWCSWCPAGCSQSPSRCLTILPIALRGSSSRKRISRGRLCGASLSALSRELAGHVVDELALRRAAGSVGHDPADDALAEVGVGLARDGRLADTGVFEQRDLDLARADLEAAGLDQVGRAPADDPPVAVGRARGEVAGEEPAVAHRLRGRVGPVEVAVEQVRAADRDLADRLVVGPLDVGAVVGDEADLDARHRDPDVAGAARRVGAHRGVHERLGEPVALDDLLAGQLLDAGELGRGQRRRARDEQASLLEAVDDRRVLLGGAAEPVVHRRDAEQHRRPVA